MDIAKIRKKKKLSEPDVRRVNAQTEEQHIIAPARDEMSSGSKESEEIILPSEAETKHEGYPSGAEATEEKSHNSGIANIEVKVEQGEAEEIVEILSFGLLREEFAFRVSQLEEILKYQRITRVPKAPDYVAGITSLRGKVIPVIDLKLKLCLTDKASNIDRGGKILILKGAGGPIGAIVDKVIGVLRIRKTEILPPPSHLRETELKFIEGVAVMDRRFISLVNMEEAINIKMT
ncbi:MAG: chemotaxis protein CheW [Nitrospirota bacterium]